MLLTWVANTNTAMVKNVGAMHRFLECRVDQYMTPTVETVTRQVTMRNLEALFEKHDFNAFPVVEAGKMLGIVTKFDFLKAFAFTTSQIVPHFDELMGRTVADVMTEAVVADVFGMASRVVIDPISDTPMIIPIGRHHVGPKAFA